MRITGEIVLSISVSILLWNMSRPVVRDKKFWISYLVFAICGLLSCAISMESWVDVFYRWLAIVIVAGPIIHLVCNVSHEIVSTRKGKRARDKTQK